MNGKRRWAALKRAINKWLRSCLTEEKSYTDYADPR
jgi:hypothetical protein